MIITLSLTPSRAVHTVRHRGGLRCNAVFRRQRRHRGTLGNGAWVVDCVNWANVTDPTTSAALSAS
ncbi:MAG: hypothetical protein ACLR3C_15635 [Eggerthella lenta]